MTIPVLRAVSDLEETLTKVESIASLLLAKLEYAERRNAELEQKLNLAERTLFALTNERRQATQ